MLYNLPVTAAIVSAFALITATIPGPIMIDMLGFGLASLGAGMIYDHR